MQNYFLTAAERAEIIDEAVYVDCENSTEFEPVTYRAFLESLSNSELVRLCCNP